MPPSDDSDEHGDVAHETYTPEQERSLSEAVLDAIEAYTGTDLSKSEFVLYDAIEADALDRLIQHDAAADAKLKFPVEDMEVRLQGNCPVEIEVIELPDE